MDCIWNRIPVVENLWKIAKIYFQARSVFRHSKIRENDAETADTVDIAPVGIDYGKPKDDADRWLRLNGPVKFSYFYSKCYLKLVL